MLDLFRQWRDLVTTLFTLQNYIWSALIIVALFVFFSVFLRKSEILEFVVGAGILSPFVAALVILLAPWLAAFLCIMGLGLAAAKIKTWFVSRKVRVDCNDTEQLSPADELQKLHAEERRINVRIAELEMETNPLFRESAQVASKK